MQGGATQVRQARPSAQAIRAQAMNARPITGQQPNPGARMPGG